VSDKLQYAHAELSRLLNQAELVFKRSGQMKLTLVCRHPTKIDRYIVLTSEANLADAIDCIRRSENAPEVKADER
jgi:hypothetical protein